jgi:hypothetical protein
LIYATRRLVMLAAIVEIIGPEALQNLWVWTHCWHIARIAHSLLFVVGWHNMKFKRRERAKRLIKLRAEGLKANRRAKTLQDAARLPCRA